MEQSSRRESDFPSNPRKENDNSGPQNVEIEQPHPSTATPNFPQEMPSKQG